MYDKDKRGSRETNAGFMLLGKATPAKCIGIQGIKAFLYLLQKHMSTYMFLDKTESSLRVGMVPCSPHYPQYCGK